MISSCRRVLHIIIVLARLWEVAIRILAICGIGCRGVLIAVVDHLRRHRGISDAGANMRISRDIETLLFLFLSSEYFLDESHDEKVTVLTYSILCLESIDQSRWKETHAFRGEEDCQRRLWQEIQAFLILRPVKDR